MIFIRATLHSSFFRSSFIHPLVKNVFIRSFSRSFFRAFIRAYIKSIIHSFIYLNCYFPLFLSLPPASFLCSMPLSFAYCFLLLPPSFASCLLPLLPVSFLFFLSPTFASCLFPASSLASCFLQSSLPIRGSHRSSSQRSSHASQRRFTRSSPRVVVRRVK